MKPNALPPKGSRLYLSQPVVFRLNMQALIEEKTLSDVAEDILDRYLPTFKVSIENPPHPEEKSGR